jgi:hypothetical protein
VSSPALMYLACMWTNALEVKRSECDRQLISAGAPASGDLVYLQQSQSRSTRRAPLTGARGPAQPTVNRERDQSSIEGRRCKSGFVPLRVAPLAKVFGYARKQVARASLGILLAVTSSQSRAKCPG